MVVPRSMLWTRRGTRSGIREVTTGKDVAVDVEEDADQDVRVHCDVSVAGETICSETARNGNPCVTSARSPSNRDRETPSLAASSHSE